MLTQPTAPPLSADPPSRASRLRKYLKQGVITLVAFAIAAALLNQIIPSPAIPPNVVFVSPKYAHYQTHKDEYNTLFFGSSRIFNQVVPGVFDANARTAGTRINSFNFGVPALRALPGYVLLRDVLKDPPVNLKWVFIETPLDQGYEPIENARTNRSIYWHTFENTWFAIDYILKSDSAALHKPILIASHVLPFIYNQINIGRLFNQWLPITQFSTDEQQKAAQFLANEGYKPLNDPQDPKRQAFLNSLDSYQTSVQQLAARNLAVLKQEAIPKNQLKLLKKITAEVEAAGATPIFLLPPTLVSQDSLHQAYQQSKIRYLLAFDNPNETPGLYDIALRHDDEHLNGEGSRHFTQLIAKAFVETIQPQT
ncbi:MAG: hypothetical protein AAF152_13340 [Cyanobacteria bacterium P01_A01_bin.114]